MSLPPNIRDAEDVLTRLRGVCSAHIVLDAEGGIAEVHVVASGDRPAKQIVRDVETFLSARLGAHIDHRKISVACLEEPKSVPPPSPAQISMSAEKRHPESSVGLSAPGGGEPSAPDASDIERRIRFNGMNLSVTGLGCEATVELSRGLISTSGGGKGAGSGKSALRPLAEATLTAFRHYYQEGPAFVLDQVCTTMLGEREVVLVSVSYQRGREEIHLLGSTFVGVDPQRAVIFATLDAVNRFSGRLKERGFVEYEVGPSPARS